MSIRPITLNSANYSGFTKKCKLFRKAIKYFFMFYKLIVYFVIFCKSLYFVFQILHNSLVLFHNLQKLLLLYIIFTKVVTYCILINKSRCFFFSFYTTASPRESSSTFCDRRARPASSVVSSPKPKF